MKKNLLLILCVLSQHTHIISQAINDETIRLLTPEPLFSVIASNDVEAANKLIIENPLRIHNRNAKGQTALHYASQEGCTEIAALLLANGAIPNTFDHEGTTPFYSARRNNHASTVTLLLENHANPNIVSQMATMLLDTCKQQTNSSSIKKKKRNVRKRKMHSKL